MFLMEFFKNSLLKNTTTRQTILKNTFWFTVSQGLSKVLRAIIVIYAARVLGTTQWGIFSFLLSLASILVLFSELGINSLVTRLVSRHPESPDTSINTAITLRCILSIVFGILFITLSSFSHSIPNAPLLFALMAVVTLFDMLRDLGVCIARGIEHLQIEAAIQIFSNFSIVTLGLLFLLKDPSVLSLTSAYAIASVAGFTLTIFLLRDYITNLSFSLQWSEVKKVVFMALPFSIPLIMGTIMANTDTVLIRYFGSLKDVGVYSAAQRLIQITAIIPGLLAVPLFPLMARLVQSDKKRLATILEKTLSFMVLLALPFTLYAIVYGKEVVHLVYGTEYMLATASLQVLAGTILFTFPFTMLNNVIFSLDERWTIFSYSLIGVICNGALDLLLIPSLGIAGAALSTTINTAVIVLYTFFRVQKTLSISSAKILSQLFIPTIIACILTLILYYSHVHFLIAGIIFIATYGIVLLNTKHPLIDELVVLIKKPV